MVRINPQRLKKDGKEQFVVLTTEEYAAIRQRLEDAEDVLALRAAKAADEGKPSISLAEVKRRLSPKKAKAK